MKANKMLPRPDYGCFYCEDRGWMKFTGDPCDRCEFGAERKAERDSRPWRSLSDVFQFAAIVGLMFFVLGVAFYLGGVNEAANVSRKAQTDAGATKR